jgi:hypothetical protein
MPIEFRCPHCGTQTSVPDSVAGRTGACFGCGKPLVVPPADSADGYALPAKRSKWPIILIAVLALAPVALLVLVCCGGVLLGLALPAVNAARETARRMECANNLKQISLAMLQYEQMYHSLPPAFVVDKNGRPMHSWRVLLLPYMDEDLYKEYHFDEPWDGPHNRALANRMPAIYHCPSAGPMGSVTSYVVIVGPRTAFPGAKPAPASEINKDAASTILVVEAPRAGINWLEPRDLREEEMHFKINGDPKNEIGSFHVRGANVSYCDASVHYFADSMDAKVLKQLIERKGK